MGVRYTLVESNTTDAPSNATATYNRGFNVPGGAVDEVIIRVSQTLNAASDISADWPNCCSALRLILNGETVWDYTGGYTSATNNAASPLGYLLNSMGRGRSVEVNTGDATREVYLRIPIGRNIAAGISRFEYSISYAALAGASTGNTVQWWIRYNPAMQTTPTLGAATTFNYSATTQQVVMRVPQNVPGTLAGVIVQNDRANDTDITDFRIVSQSDFSMDTDMWRALNGDLYNGVEYMDPATADQLTFAQGVDGAYFLPLFGLSLKDDLRMQVTAASARTLSLTPVITSGIAGKPAPAQVQTQAVKTNVAKSVLDDSAAQV